MWSAMAAAGDGDAVDGLFLGGSCPSMSVPMVVVVRRLGLVDLLLREMGRILSLGPQ